MPALGVVAAGACRSAQSIDSVPHTCQTIERGGEAEIFHAAPHCVRP